MTKAYANFIPELWGQKINAALEKNTVMLQCVNRNWESEIADSGDSIHIVTPGDVTVSSYTGTISSYSALSSTTAELELDQEKYFGFSIPDISKVQANANLMQAYVDRAKKALEVTIDTHIFSNYTSADSNNILHNTTALVLTTSNIYGAFVELAKTLKTSDALNDGQSPWVVIHPDVEELLLKCSEFTSASHEGDICKREGAIGKVAGLEVLVSTNVGKVSSNYYLVAGTNDAITFASQIKKIETVRDSGSFSDIVRGLYVYGSKVINAKALATTKATI